jgi:hypothetical protein
MTAAAKNRSRSAFFIAMLAVNCLPTEKRSRRSLARFTHDDAELNESFEGNFTPIVRQMYDEATEGLELYQ